MADPTVFPLLPWSVDARICQAAAVLLAADEVLAGVLSGGVFPAETQQLLLADSVPAFALAVTLLADEEKSFGSSYSANYEVVLQLILLTPVPEGFGSTDDMLRSRLVAQIRRVLRANRGVLTDPDGAELTLAITRITRINLDGALPTPGLLRTVIQVAYTAPIDLAQQEILE